MDRTRDLSSVWTETQERLPEGWSLDGLRCASTGLSVGERSDDWIAVAVGPSDEERHHRADEPISDLEGLAATFEAG